MTKESQNINDELLKLQNFAKQEIPKISNMDDFIELNRDAILSILIKIENEHKEKYNSNSTEVLNHSTIEFSIANPNNDCYSFDLIKLENVDNLPDNLKLDTIIKIFNNNYLTILSSVNSNGKSQNFLLSGAEVSAFYNLLSISLTNNQAIKCNVTTHGIERYKIEISLNLV